jgi:hypothetical protein
MGGDGDQMSSVRIWRVTGKKRGGQHKCAVCVQGPGCWPLRLCNP